MPNASDAPRLGRLCVVAPHPLSALLFRNRMSLGNLETEADLERFLNQRTPPNLDKLLRQLQGRWRFGTGSPEGVVTAPPGVGYLNDSGGAGTTLYVKESGTGKTGWVAK